MTVVDAYLDPTSGDLPEISRLCTGLDLIQQRIRLRLNRGVGEYFLDPVNVGLPLIEWREQKPPQLGAIQRRIEDEIRQVPGVVRTQDFVATHDAGARRVTVTGNVIVDTGEVTAIVATAAGDVVRNSMSFGVQFSSNNIRGAAPRPSSRRP